MPEFPDRIGLCPDPDHMGEFYMPLDDGDSENCPYDCPERLVVYVPAVLSGEKVESFAKFMACDEDPRFVPMWDKNQSVAMKAVRAEFRRKARLYLQVAGFVSEPSTGGDDAD